MKRKCIHRQYSHIDVLKIGKDYILFSSICCDCKKKFKIRHYNNGKIEIILLKEK